MLPAKCCQPNVASHGATTTTRRRRRRDDAATTTRRRGSGDGAGESLQVPLTVAADPRCPHSRCSPPKRLHCRCSLVGTVSRPSQCRGRPAAQVVGRALVVIPPHLHPHRCPHRPASHHQRRSSCARRHPPASTDPHRILTHPLGSGVKRSSEAREAAATARGWGAAAPKSPHSRCSARKPSQSLQPPQAREDSSEDTSGELQMFCQIFCLSVLPSVLRIVVPARRLKTQSLQSLPRCS